MPQLFQYRTLLSPDAPLPGAELSETEQADLAQSTILVVDDNAQNVELLQAYLEALPCKILTAYDGIEADMVDMESWAVLRAAKRFGLPMVGLRGISDGRNDLTGLHDWTEYLHILDEKLAAVIEALPDHVRAGRFHLRA